ncbi:MAG: hypothetical protein HZC42_05630 [Candidatus Eisenbacteria bacterium]|nr:hypothetical protein [Candidatus Eisenbacteria bacterium]
MIMRCAVVPLSLACLLPLFLCSPARAQWTKDGVAVCTAAGSQFMMQIAEDGSGGVFVVWSDPRGGGGTNDIYAQRFDAAGVPQWTANGVVVCAATGMQWFPRVVAGGSGSAIVAWQDNRSGGADTYAQRLDAAGAPQWTADGVAVCTATGTQAAPLMVPDGAGGAVLAWGDFRSAIADGYAQRINSSGVPQWTADGIVWCRHPASLTLNGMVSDGAGGAIVVWYDDRVPLVTRVYARRIDALGDTLWDGNGVALAGTSGWQDAPVIVPDGAGGALVGWADDRTGSYSEYMQRLTSLGAVAPGWPADGQLVSASDVDHYDDMAPDGAGGAVLVWNETGSGGPGKVHAAHVTSAAVVDWNHDIATPENNPAFPRAVSDGAGGAIVTWSDSRNGVDNDVFAVRFISTGVAPGWGADGDTLCGASGQQTSGVIASDGAGGAVVAWGDTRNYGATQSDIYAGRVQNDGTVAALLALASASAEPGRVRLEWYAATGAGLIATVYRRAPGGAWEARATASPDGTGRLRYEDRAVTAGARYGYRLGVGSGRDERFFGEVWVDVPVDLGFALGGVRPNPSAGALWVSFSLPDGAPTELALFDLAGRRLAARPVGSFGSGNHVARLEPALRPRPGVYIVALTRGARSLTSRATIVR